MNTDTSSVMNRNRSTTIPSRTDSPAAPPRERPTASGLNCPRNAVDRVPRTSSPRRTDVRSPSSGTDLEGEGEEGRDTEDAGEDECLAASVRDRGDTAVNAVRTAEQRLGDPGGVRGRHTQRLPVI